MQMIKEKRSIYFVAALIMLATVFVYLPALQNDFVQWDDDKYVYKNQHIRSSGSYFFRWAFTSFYAANWHPLTWISHAVDYAIWGLNPLGHHLTSMVFHGLNAFLVVLLTVKLIESRVTCSESHFTICDSRFKLIAAGVTGLLFGLHPIHVESVAWVSERKDVLCAFFFLLSIFAYMGYVSAGSLKKKRSLYLISIICFFLALMSKPMAVTLPVVLLIFDVYPLERLKIRHLHLSVFIEKAPFFVLSIISSVLTVLAQQDWGAISSLTTYPFLERFWVGIRGFVFYLFKMIWPTNLAPYYPYPAEGTLFSFEFLASVVVLAAIIFFSILSWRRRKIYLIVLSYYIVILLPVSGIIIQVGGQAVADRYSYLPSLGPSLLVGLAFAKYWQESHNNNTKLILRRTLLILTSSLIFLFFAVITIKQTGIWHDSISLWDAEQMRFPKYPLANYQKGEVYIKRGDFNKALEEFNETIRKDPKFLWGYYSRGLTLLMLGNSKQAMLDFNSTIELNPDHKQAFINRTMACKLVIKDATKAIEARPDNADAYFNRGLGYELMGDYPNALKDYVKTIGFRPDDEAALFHRATTYLRLGVDDEASKDFLAAARLGSLKARKHLQSKGISW